MCIVYREIYFKGWADTIVGLANLKSSGRPTGWKPKEELNLQSCVQRQNFSLRVICLFLLRPFSDCMRPTYIMGSDLLYSKSDDLSVNHICKVSS